MMITSDDAILLLATMLELTALAWLISRLITFIPNLMGSIIKKVKNNSIIYSQSQLHDPNLESNLDKSDLGSKTLIERWLKL